MVNICRDLARYFALYCKRESIDFAVTLFQAHIMLQQLTTYVALAKSLRLSEPSVFLFYWVVSHCVMEIRHIKH